MLPVLIWLLGWFEWWFGIPAAALTAAIAWPLLAGSWRPTWPRPTEFVCCFVALAWVMLSPAGGYFGWSVDDWIAHRGIFLDLTNRPWPAHLAGYVDDVDAAPPLFRFYVAWYVLPSLLGKWFGPGALNWAIPLWTWFGVALIVLLFTRGLSLGRAVVAAFVLILFSGLDVLEIMLHEGLLQGIQALRVGFGQGSLDWSYEWGPTRLAFLSPMENLFWGPTHFIAAGIGALLVIQLSRHPRFLAGGGVILACLLMWSPLVCAGLLPLVIGLALKPNGFRRLLGWRNLCAAPLLAGVIGLYLTIGAGDLPRGWIWDSYAQAAPSNLATIDLDVWNNYGLAVALTLAYLAEFALLALLVWRLQPQLSRNPFFIAAMTTMLVLFWFYYGSQRVADFSIRAGAPATILLAYWAARAIARHLPARLGKSGGLPVGLRVGLLATALLVGSIGPISELKTRIWQGGRFVPYQTGGWSLGVDRGEHDWRIRTAYEVPDILGFLLSENGTRASFNPGELLIESDYDVWRKGSRLIYASDSCDRTDGFFALIHPEHRRSLPARSGGPNLGFEILGMEVWRVFVRKHDGHCVTAARLPQYDIACIQTGQVDPSGRITWQGEHAFTSCPAKLPQYLNLHSRTR